MFKDLNVFQLAHAMASHAGHRQSVIAQNVANADTPGYLARDVVAFADTIAAEDLDSGLHRGAGQTPLGSERWQTFTPNAPVDPNNNSVAIEQEMLKAVETARQHERAISIYRSAVSVLRTSLGRG